MIKLISLLNEWRVSNVPKGWTKLELEDDTDWEDERTETIEYYGFELKGATSGATLRDSPDGTIYNALVSINYTEPFLSENGIYRVQFWGGPDILRKIGNAYTSRDFESYDEAKSYLNTILRDLSSKIYL